MQKLSLKKQTDIIRLYLSGLSYNDISAKAGVAKGTVANIINDLKAGRLLSVHEPSGQVELLRELAIDLRNSKLTAGQSLSGVAIISHLKELGIEPSDIPRWAAMCRQLVTDPDRIPAVVSSAMALEEIRIGTGLSPEELEKKVKVLRAEENSLQVKVNNLKNTEKRLAEQEKHLDKVSKELAQLQQRSKSLQKEIDQQEKRKSELYRNVQELEMRFHHADTGLTTARAELKNLAELGLTQNDLTGLVHRIAAVAQKHLIEPKALSNRLFSELEKLEQGLGLETLVQTRRKDLDRLNDAITKTNNEQNRLKTAVDVLRTEEIALQSSIAQQRQVVSKTMQEIAEVIAAATDEMQNRLKTGVMESIGNVGKLSDMALNLGHELGHMEEIIQANQWLHTLLALVKGDNGINAIDIKNAVFTILTCFKRWTRSISSPTYLSPSLTTYLDYLTREVEQWRI